MAVAVCDRMCAVGEMWQWLCVMECVLLMKCGSGCVCNSKLFNESVWKCNYEIVINSENHFNYHQQMHLHKISR